MESNGRGYKLMGKYVPTHCREVLITPTAVAMRSLTVSVWHSTKMHEERTQSFTDLPHPSSVINHFLAIYSTFSVTFLRHPELFGTSIAHMCSQRFIPVTSFSFTLRATHIPTPTSGHIYVKVAVSGVFELVRGEWIK